MSCAPIYKTFFWIRGDLIGYLLTVDIMLTAKKLLLLIILDIILILLPFPILHTISMTAFERSTFPTLIKNSTPNISSLDQNQELLSVFTVLIFHHLIMGKALCRIKLLRQSQSSYHLQ